MNYPPSEEKKYIVNVYSEEEDCSEQKFFKEVDDALRYYSEVLKKKHDKN